MANLGTPNYGVWKASLAEIQAIKMFEAQNLGAPASLGFKGWCSTSWHPVGLFLVKTIIGLMICPTQIFSQSISCLEGLYFAPMALLTASTLIPPHTSKELKTACSSDNPMDICSESSLVKPTLVEVETT